MNPKVSVILTTYNGSSRGYLKAAIESVLNQSFRDFELLIIDDGSSDRTAEECRKYLENDRVKYIFQENKGLAGARNTGISSSFGEFICFLDDDDIWKPEKLNKQLAFIQNRLSGVDNWGLIFTWLELIDEQGEVISYRGHHREGQLYRSLLFGNTVDAPSSVLIRREVFDNVGLFDEFFENCQDWDMWLRISKEYLIFPVKEYLVQHREHKKRISFDNEKVFHYEKAVIEKALASAPADISPRAIYASCYMNRSISYFAADQYQQFREMLMKGAKLSLKPIRLEHILLFLLSLFGRRSAHLCRSVKRFVQQRMITHRYGDFGPYS
jgi:glycosyltransferase involved in cell wall biosynthesis